jgi:hypothetical protein
MCPQKKNVRVGLGHWIWIDDGILLTQFIYKPTYLSVDIASIALLQHSQKVITIVTSSLAVAMRVSMEEFAGMDPVLSYILFNQITAGVSGFIAGSSYSQFCSPGFYFVVFVFVFIKNIQLKNPLPPAQN